MLVFIAPLDQPKVVGGVCQQRASELRSQLPPPPSPPPAPPCTARPVTTPATTPQEPSPEDRRRVTLLALVSLCINGPIYVYIFCTIDPRGDDLILLLTFIGLGVSGLGSLFGLCWGLAGIVDLFEHCQKKPDSAVKTVATEAQDEDKNVEEEDGENVEEEGQQEMLELLTAQRGYAASDNIV